MLHIWVKQGLMVGLVAVLAAGLLACAPQAQTSPGGEQPQTPVVQPGDPAGVTVSPNTAVYADEYHQGNSFVATDYQFALPNEGGVGNASQADAHIVGGIPGGQGAPQVDTTSTGIYVSGTGKASGAPDLATLMLGVQALEPTVSDARDKAAVAMAAVLKTVKDNGVLSKDIQTGHFRIQPRYNSREITRCVEVDKDMPSSEGGTSGQGTGTTQGPATSGMTAEPKTQECFKEYKSVITGYEVSNSVSVLVRDLNAVDDVIDDAVEAGGESIRFNGLNFSIEDTSKLESTARAAAVANLEAKAKELAAAAGVGLGTIDFLGETTGTTPPMFRAEFAVAADSSGGPPTSVSPGQVTVTVNVVGHYRIPGVN